MKAIVNTARGKLAWQELPVPKPKAGQVRIRTAACGICATDLEMIAGWSRTGFPAIPGHEWSGTVDAVGAGVDPKLVGTRCVAENVLKDGGEVGFEHPGGYAECFISEAANVQRLPASFPMALATLIEPLAVAVRARRRLGIAGRQRILIIGDGPIGLLMTLLLSRDRHEVVLVGGRKTRLAVARKLGAAQTANYHDFQKDKLVEGITRKLGIGFAGIVEASGSATALTAAMDLVRHQGKILLVGDYGTSCASFPWNRILHRELDMIGTNASAEAWPEAVALAVKHRALLKHLVTHVVSAPCFAEAIALVKNTREGVIKVVLDWSKN